MYICIWRFNVIQTKEFFSEYLRAEVSGSAFSLHKDLKWSLWFVDTYVFAYTDFNIYASSKLIYWPICGGTSATELQRAAVCCRVCCSVRCVAVRCIMLQCVAVWSRHLCKRNLCGAMATFSRLPKSVCLFRKRGFFSQVSSAKET